MVGNRNRVAAPAVTVPPLSLEDRLILASARSDADLAQLTALIARAPNWQTLVRKAEHWGVAALVYASVRQVAPLCEVPAPALDQLRHLYRRDTIHSVDQRDLLRVALLRFAAEGISAVVLHGAALATGVYPVPALRTIGDIDLLVRPDDLEHALRVVTGIRTEHPSLPYLGPWGLDQLILHRRIETARGPTVARLTASRIPVEDIWSRSQPAEIESIATRVLSREDLLLQLALLLTESERVAGHLRTLCDFGETCRRYQQEIDWQRLASLAARYRVAKQLSFVLRLARDLVGVEVPPSAVTALRSSFQQIPGEHRLIAAVVREAMLADGPVNGPGWARYRLGVQLLATRRAAEVVSITREYVAHNARTRRPGVRLAERLSQPFHRASTPAVPEAARPSPAAPERPASAPPVVEQSLAEAIQATVGAHLTGELAVTYDQKAASDGLGAQVQRIYGLYALARALQIKYVHTPLERVGYQGFISLLTGRMDPEFVERYNAFFALPSDDFDLANCERIHIHNLNLATVERYRGQVAATGRSILLVTLLPFAYTDEYPAAYHSLRDVSPYRDFRPSGPIRVCIHLRRGDNLPDSRRRWLPNSYYLRVCGQILSALEKHGVAYTVRLHSEMPTRRFALYPESPGLYFVPEQPVTIDPEDYALEDFDALSNLEMVFNAEPRDSLDDFATADVLILSASSFGYLGGILNPHGVVVFAPLTWNKPVPGWLVADADGNLDAADVSAKISALLQRRR